MTYGKLFQADCSNLIKGNYVAAIYRSCCEPAHICDVTALGCALTSLCACFPSKVQILFRLLWLLSLPRLHHESKPLPDLHNSIIVQIKTMPCPLKAQVVCPHSLRETAGLGRGGKKYETKRREKKSLSCERQFYITLMQLVWVQQKGDLAWGAEWRGELEHLPISRHRREMSLVAFVLSNLVCISFQHHEREM